MGIATGLGGLALLVVAAATAFRRKPRRSFARRWAARIGAAPATGLTVPYLATPVFAAIFRVHKTDGAGYTSRYER